MYTAEKKLDEETEKKISVLINMLRMTHLFGPIDERYREYEELEFILRKAYYLGYRECSQKKN
jgi:hypothetical protein